MPADICSNFCFAIVTVDGNKQEKKADMREKKTCGVIYILTNPSFPDYVKIGYADDMERRLRELNRSECIPFAFRVYATYEVETRLSDLKLHNMIDKLIQIFAL